MTLICVTSSLSLTFNSPHVSFLLSLSLCVSWFLSSGVVRVSLADMDRETRENYTVVIQAKDMGGQLGGLAGTTTVNITLSDINDNPPMFDQSKRWTTVLPYCTLSYYPSIFVFFPDSLSSPLYLNPHHLLIPPDTLTAEKEADFKSSGQFLSRV